MTRSSLLRLAWVAVLIPPLLIAWMIVVYGVNVAVFDQIPIGAFLARNHDRIVPPFSELFAQHNESRKFFPRLIIFYLARLTGWDVRFEMGVIVLLAAGLVFCLAQLARRTLPDRPSAMIATVFASLLVFSPVQWWNWLFGIQMVVFIPPLMLALALLSAKRGLVVPALCCVVATYSYANGMLLWFLLLPVVVWHKRAALIPWLVATATAIGMYFIGYQRPPTHPSLVMSRPMELVGFVLAFLGHPLSWTDRVTPNVVAGGAALALFAVFTILALRRREVATALPWILLGLYSIASAGITAMGRLGYGLATAVEPRYTTFAIPLLVSMVALGLLVTPPSLRRAGAAALVLLLVMHVMASRREWWYARANHRDRLISHAATQWSAVLRDKSALQRFVDPDVDRATRVIGDLDAIGYVNPPRLTTDLLRPARGNGFFEGALRLSTGERVLRGWALLPDGRPADAVIIARAERDGEHALALSHRTIARPDLAARTGVLAAGWDLPITRELAVAGSVYTAWAYDTSTRAAYKLPGSVSTSRR